MIEAMTTAVDTPQESRTESPPVSEGTSAHSGVTIDEVIGMLLRGRRLIAVCTAAGFLLAIGIALFQHRPYVAAASFLPERTDQSAAAGLASQLGLTTGGPGQSLGFYAYLLLSRENLTEVIEHEYVFEANGEGYSGNLIQLLEIDGETPSGRLRGAMNHLQRAIAVEVDGRAGLVRFTVEAPWAALAEQIAARLIDGVQGFNVERLRSRATAESEFLALRIDVAGRELRVAEDSLARFLNQNRRFENAPELRFEYERLRRELQLKQRVHADLAAAYEQAKIDRVRSTPVITVVEDPTNSATRTGRRLPLKVAIGVAFGAMLGVLIVLGRGLVGSVGAQWRTLVRTSRGAAPRVG